MRYIQPQILRADDAALALQHVFAPDNEKPLGSFVDFRGTKSTDLAAYEADE